MDQKNIEKEIKEQLNALIGCKMTPSVIETVREQVEKTLNTKASTCSDVKVDVLWKVMPFREKIKWFIFNKFPFKAEGDAHRSAIARWQHYRWLATWEIAHEELPHYLEPSPKSVLVFQAQLNLTQPLEYITLNFTL